LEVARTKPDAGAVRWILGDATALPPLQMDLATMTGNVGQVFLTDAAWQATLHGIRAALRPGGRLVFETRVPARRAWLEWDREHTYSRTEIPAVGLVTTWCDLLEVNEPLVTFRWTFVFEADGAVVTSNSTLRFPERDEVEASLTVAGYTVEEVRDAPDRPGRELVFVARPRDRAVLEQADTADNLPRVGSSPSDTARRSRSGRRPPSSSRDSGARRR
jgi:SAM-dependent methyltransferase